MRGTVLDFFLPARPGGTVLEQNAAGRQIVADAVGGGEVAPAPGRMPLLDQPLDLLDRDRRLFVFRPAQAQHAEHLVEFVERRANRRDIAGAELSRCRSRN